MKLFGIRMNAKTFRICKICQFRKDIQSISLYADCWYDTKSKALLLLHKTSRTVQFKIYEMDNTVSFNLKLPKQLQILLDSEYITAKKSCLYRHKPTDSLLLFFGCNVVLFAVDFDNVKLISLSIGRIKEFNPMEIKSINKMNVDGFRMNASNVVLDDVDRFDFDYNSDLSILMRRIRDLDGVSFSDFIIGFDELRSCLVVNLDECRRELQSLYKFKILV